MNRFWEVPVRIDGSAFGICRALEWNNHRKMLRMGLLNSCFCTVDIPRKFPTFLGMLKTHGRLRRFRKIMSCKCGKWQKRSMRAKMMRKTKATVREKTNFWETMNSNKQIPYEQIECIIIFNL
mmetsp:Transcript_86198/g.248909  ORF Transcript_86198/g.248909 Transcript_86198/m.248909 type:complete len:123 (+) Transcript_86198:1208-1576(+)